MVDQVLYKRTVHSLSKRISLQLKKWQKVNC